MKLGLIIQHDVSFDLNSLCLLDLQLNALTYNNESNKNVIKLNKLTDTCLTRIDDCTTFLNYEIDITDNNSCELYSKNKDQVKNNFVKCSIDMKYTSDMVRAMHLSRLFKKSFAVKFSEYIIANDISILDHR
jgi:hypothetical protein